MNQGSRPTSQLGVTLWGSYRVHQYVRISFKASSASSNFLLQQEPVRLIVQLQLVAALLQTRRKLATPVATSYGVVSYQLARVATRVTGTKLTTTSSSSKNHSNPRYSLVEQTRDRGHHRYVRMEVMMLSFGELFYIATTRACLASEQEANLHLRLLLPSKPFLNSIVTHQAEAKAKKMSLAIPTRGLLLASQIDNGNELAILVY